MNEPAFYPVRFAFVLRLLVDWAMPFGYLIEFFIQCGSTFSVLFIIVAAICHFIGTCWIFVAIIQDISNELHTLNADEESHPNEREWKERLNNIIQLHSDVKQLSEIRINLSNKINIKFELLISDFTVISTKSMNSKFLSSS